MGLTAGGARWIGPLCSVFGVLGFSLKAIFVKLAYAAHPVDAVTLLALRMLFAAPFFVAMAWWSGRRRDARAVSARDWRALVWLGFIGYYLGSLLDFLGLMHISAALERLVLYLYPTMVLVLSVVLRGRRVSTREVVALAVSYAGIALVFIHDLQFGGDARALWIGGGLVFASALSYAIYLIGAGDVIGRLGSMRFIAWAMLASSVFIFAQFALTRDLAALAVPPSIYALSFAMAVISTVLPTWLIAEAVRRLGANTSSLIGSLGPVFTIGLGAMILGEAVHWVQLAGAALVLSGVLLVTLGAGRERDRAAAAAAETPGT